MYIEEVWVKGEHFLLSTKFSKKKIWKRKPLDLVGENSHYSYIIVLVTYYF